MRPLRIGIIGMGGFAMTHHDAVRTLEAQGEFRLICTCDPHMDSFDARQEDLHFRQRGVKLFTDYLEMLDACGAELDFVTIPTPIPLHASMHRACVERGIPVYLEKPPTLNYAELDEMLAVETQAQKLTNVGFNFIVEPERQALKRRLRAGEFGNVTHVGYTGRWPRGTQYYARAPWAGRLQLNGRLVLDSCMGNAMAHYLHNTLYWAGIHDVQSWGTVTSVSAELYRANAIEGMDTAFTKIAIADGPEIRIAMSHACSGETEEQEWVTCEKATLVSGVENTAATPYKYFTIRWTDGRTETIRFEPVDLVARNFAAYGAYVRGECARPVTRLVDSRPFVQVNDLAYIAANRITTVPPSLLQTTVLESGDTYTTIPDLTSIDERFMATGEFPSAQGVSWAVPGGTAAIDELPQLESVIAKMVNVRDAELAAR